MSWNERSIAVVISFLVPYYFLPESSLVPPRGFHIVIALEVVGKVCKGSLLCVSCLFLCETNFVIHSDSDQWISRYSSSSELSVCSVLPLTHLTQECPCICMIFIVSILFLTHFIQYSYSVLNIHTGSLTVNALVHDGWSFFFILLC